MPLSIPRIKIDQFRYFLLIHGVLTGLTVFLALCATSRGWGSSFTLGQLFVWISLLSISLPVYLFFLKKNIALLVGFIVFKWPILVYMVFRLTQSVELDSVAFSIGFIPVFISALVWSILQKE